MTSLARLFSRNLVRKNDFARWAKEAPRVDAIHHYHALRACWPYLAGGPQKILDVGPDPVPWLAAVQQFSRHSHDLWAARQGSACEEPAPPGMKISTAEFDVWSPIRNAEAPNALCEKNFTLVTALHVVDRMYHPDLLFRVLAGAMAPRGILVVAASNVARLGNVMGLLSGGGLAGDLDALIGRRGLNQPRPRVREYCWQELNAAAFLAGLAPVEHRFYDNDGAIAAARSDAELPASQSPPAMLEPATMGNTARPSEPAVRQAIAPFLRERGQLQSEMILIFRKAGAGALRLHRARHGVYPLLREAKAKLDGVRRRLRT